MNDNTRRAFAALLLIGVSVATMITAIRQYSTAYMMVEPSQEYAMIAAFMVVGSIVLAVLFPASTRYGFWVLVVSLITAIAISVAPKLGLIEHAPLLWRVALLLAIALPVGVVVSQMRNFITPPKPAETGRNLIETHAQIDIEEPPDTEEEEGSEPQLLANPDNETAAETAETLIMLNETLDVVRRHRGNMAAAAKELNLTAPGVGRRMQRLYKVNPDQVQRYAPQWVQRNIKK